MRTAFNMIRIRLSVLGLVICILYLNVANVYGATPIAKHHIQVAAPETDYVITLPAYDADGHSMNTTIKTLPTLGTLYQLTDVYSNYGYDPKKGTAISSTDTLVSYIASNRILFSAPLGFTRTQFEYSVTDQDGTSSNGIVFILLTDKIVQNSDFVQSAEDWLVSSVSDVSASWSATSTGSLNHFVYSDTIAMTVGSKNNVRWSFKAPSKFYTNYGMSYNGYMQFWLTSFAGDFSSNVYSNPKTFVEMTCSTCDSGNGITLAQRNITYTGDTRYFNFQLNEALANDWKKDPKDITITEWSTPTACEFFSVLSGISSIKIFPDVTSGYESVALDEFNIVLGDADVSTACY